MPPSRDLLPLALGVADLARRRITTPDGEIRLTTTEVALLRHLAEAAGRPVPRDELLREVWGYGPGAVSRTMDVTVRRLRQKIEPDPSFPVHLLSVHGVGYTFVAADTPTAATPPAASPPPVPLPTSALADDPDPILGRASARADAWAALAGGARPLTLAGVAGVGKTRLAHALLADARAGGRSGWFVDLTAATSADDLARATAVALGLSSATDAAIARTLAESGGLVVFDNFEQLPPDAAARVGAWLDGAPSLGAVVTSRRRLGLSGEGVLSLAPLHPDDAVALFRRRARRLRHDARLDDDDTIRAIVARFEGLPLAVELAAARVRTLPVAEILARLDLAFLRDPSPSTARRATLRQALDGSWALLDEAARRALAALAALPGPTHVTVAEGLLARVGVEDPIGAMEVLADHSLVRVEEEPNTGTRVALFVAVAEYAAPRRAEVGAGGAPEAWALALGEGLARQAEKLNGADGRRAIARILAEADNVVALIDRHADLAPEAALQAASALADAASLFGGHPAELPVLERAVPLAERHGGEALRAHLLSRRAAMYERLGRPDAAAPDAETVLRLADGRPDLHLYRVRVELLRVRSLQRNERLRDALAVVESIASPALPPTLRAQLAIERGLLLTRLGEIEPAEAALTEALAIAEAIADQPRWDKAFDHLALMRSDAGRAAEMEPRIRTEAERRRAVGGDAQASPLLYVLGVVALEAGRLAEARAWFEAERGAALARRRVVAVADCELNLALVSLRAGEAAAALDLLDSALANLRATRSGIPTAAFTAHAIARIAAGQREVRLGCAPEEVPDTKPDHAFLRLGEAAVRWANARETGTGIAEAEAALRRATDGPTNAVSFDLRELARAARALLR